VISDVYISDASFKFLLHQRGDFYDLRNDRAAWMRAYQADIQNTLCQIAHGGTHCLDVGSGLGVIDSLLIRNTATHCTLIDGEDGDAHEGKGDHATPYCSRVAAERFMKENGIQPQQWRYVNPLQLNDRDFPVYDLVISFRSWCFHYPPETYQHFVNTHTCPGARIILDVRKDRPWRKDLARMWYEVRTIEEHEKFDRVLFVVRGKAQ
jgi:hypothetical protein